MERGFENNLPFWTVPEIFETLLQEIELHKIPDYYYYYYQIIHKDLT